MTTQTAPHAAHHGFNFGWIADSFAGIVQGWRAFRAYGELSHLSDDQLRDMGLRRDQLAQAAFFGRDGLK